MKVVTGVLVAVPRALGVVAVLAVPALNWVAVAPELWFHTHRLAYDAAAEMSSPDSGSHYGTDLPTTWRWLVDVRDGPLTARRRPLSVPRGTMPDGRGFNE